MDIDKPLTVGVVSLIAAHYVNTYLHACVFAFVAQGPQLQLKITTNDNYKLQFVRSIFSLQPWYMVL